MPSNWHFENDRVRIRKAEVGDFGNNTYTVACRATSTSIIVDAAADPAAVITNSAGTSPIAIVTTHGHADHVGAARQVADEARSRSEIPWLSWCTPRAIPRDRLAC